VNVTNIHNVYNTTVIHDTTVNRVSFNGGNGGISARATPEEERYANERHVGPVAAQTEHAQAARSNPEMRASVNHGRPSIAATPRPGAFNDREAVPAREAAARPSAPNDAKDLQPHAPPAAANTGNAKQDQKFQQQQEKLAAQQNQEHQKLAAQQEKEHQQLAKQNADEGARQQTEQRHQQQTQQLEEKHTQQQQHLQQRQSGGRK
jgi:hypothetical protein